MSAVLTSLELFLLAGIFFAGLGAAAAAGVVRTSARAILRLEPGARHRVLSILLLLPVLGAWALSFTATLPSVLSLAFPGLDHCEAHDDGHAHLCFVHLPEHPVNGTVLLALAVASALVIGRLSLATAALVRASRLLGALARTGTPATEPGVTLLESPEPVCMAAGLVRPRVLVSRGLLAALSPAEAAIIFAHERAHVRRRDALVGCVARLGAGFQLPPARDWLLRELDIAAEQACDEAAAAAIDDRGAVAATILKVERVARGGGWERLGAAAVGFGACAVARRVEALLDEPKRAPSWRPAVLGACLASLCLLALSSTLHHATESLISALVH